MYSCQTLWEFLQSLLACYNVDVEDDDNDDNDDDDDDGDDDDAGDDGDDDDDVHCNFCGMMSPWLAERTALHRSNVHCNNNLAFLWAIDFDCSFKH